MDFIVSAVTDIGLTKDTNQDSHNVRVFGSDNGKIVMAILCDGMGGLAKGEVASASVVSAFCKWADEKLSYYCSQGWPDKDIREDWRGIAMEYNQKIKKYADSIGTNMGTTLTAILLTQQKYYIINIGDTRAYEITENIRQLTGDHTLVAREVELGHLSPEDAEIDPRRNVLLQCIGASTDIYPDVFINTVKRGAVYMLCSDGFRHEVSQVELYQYLNPGVMLNADGMKRNMEYLVNLNKQRQERDNISVISIRTF